MSHPLAGLTPAQHDAFMWLVERGGSHHGATRNMTRKLVSLRRTGLAESEPTWPTTWFLSDCGEALRRQTCSASV